MKKYIIALLLPAVLVLIGGCSKDFLTVDDQEYLTRGKLDKLTKRPSFASKVLKSKLDGVYESFYASTGGRSGHFDAGLRFLQLQLDLTTSELVLSKPINWGIYDYLRMLFNPKYSRPNQHWKKFYSILGMLTPIINNDLPPAGEEPSEILAPLYGQVFILRGICYYYLVNLFRKPYRASAGVKDEPCVPLILKGTDEEINTQATVEEVYQQAIKDLEIGVKYAKQRENKMQVDADVANAYLTKIYLERGEWDKAVETAKACIGNGLEPKPFPDALNTEFAQLSHPDMMWGWEVTNESTFLFGSIFAHLDPTISYYTPTYQFLGYNALIDKLPETDARREWFSPGFDAADPAYKKFEDKWGGPVNGGIKEGLMMKYVAHTANGDFVYLRYSDVYLMMLEAMYEAGQIDELKGLMNKFVRLRNPEFDCSKLEGVALRDEIRFQRRVELIAEGVSWFDYRRWQIPIVRNAPGKSGKSNHAKSFPDIPPGSPMLAFPIPEREMQQNPHFKSEPPYEAP